MEPARADRDLRLQAAVDAYVQLHAACAGHARLAREAGNRVIDLDDAGLRTLLAAPATVDPVALVP